MAKKTKARREGARKRRAYIFLPHTADAKFRAFGKTLEERFANAALAMMSIMFEPGKIKPKVKKKIFVKGADIKALLYNWLEEFLFLRDSKFFILGSVKKIAIKKAKKGYALSATVAGDILDSKYEVVGPDVKAATYQEMEIADKYVQVVVDI